jgi:putative ABC transport system substrate-binding protein
MVSRRVFLAAGLAACAAPPLRAQPKPAAKTWRIGILAPVPLVANVANINELQKGLRELDYVEGRNVAFEYRSADERDARYPALAADLAAKKVDLILASNTPAALAAKKAAGSIPIVAMVTDPVETGLVASLERPGSNVTGIATLVSEVERRRLEMLRALAPGRTRVAALINMGNPALASAWKSIEAAAQGVKMQAQLADVRKPEETARVLAAAVEKGAQMVTIRVGALTPEHRQDLVRLIEQHRLPAIYAIRQFVEAGGLVSYGVNTSQTWFRVAAIADKILKGADPATLPMEKPTKFELVINRRTARNQGVVIPPDVLLRAETIT